ncbi:MAG: hypothetical protein HW421_1103 [Ignavibacteria bacterium]|nr:hypothetical protein [Ignavibacteria bacterium]
MYTSISDFREDWQNEAELTLKIFEKLTDETLSVKIHPSVRTLGRLAQHLTLSISEMLGTSGVDIETPTAEDVKTLTVAGIITDYKKFTTMVIDIIGNHYNDGNLNDEIKMYGELWKRKDVLYGLIKHQIHHRAQMTVIMRQVGLQVVGIYGPTREEWEQFKIPAEE